MTDQPPHSRGALVRRSLWQLIRVSAGRPPVPAENYPERTGPRFTGERPSAGSRAEAEYLRVVSFNIDHGIEVDRAAALFARDEAMRRADIVLLQEMEESGTERLADALGMSHVYYPAGRHPVSRRHFGNAILTTGRIVRDEKHLLPHLGRVRGTQRIAVGAGIAFGDLEIAAFSVHLATLLDASLEVQRDQLVAVLDAAEPLQGPVIIGGDFNRRALGHVVARRGYRWLTEHAGPTLGPFAVDHLFARGLPDGAAASAGVVRDTNGASDHRPVWTALRIPG